MPTYGGGANPPVRLDPWQNIVNVHWPGQVIYPKYIIIGIMLRAAVHAGTPHPNGIWGNGLDEEYCTPPNDEDLIGFSDAVRTGYDAGSTAETLATQSTFAYVDYLRFEYGPWNENPFDYEPIFSIIDGDQHIASYHGLSEVETTMPGDINNVTFEGWPSLGAQINFGMAGGDPIYAGVVGINLKTGAYLTVELNEDNTAGPYTVPLPDVDDFYDMHFRPGTTVTMGYRSWQITSAWPMPVCIGNYEFNGEFDPETGEPEVDPVPNSGRDEIFFYPPQSERKYPDAVWWYYWHEDNPIHGARDVDFAGFRAIFDISSSDSVGETVEYVCIAAQPEQYPDGFPNHLFPFDTLSEDYVLGRTYDGDPTHPNANPHAFLMPTLYLLMERDDSSS